MYSSSPKEARRVKKGIKGKKGSLPAKLSPISGKFPGPPSLLLLRLGDFARSEQWHPGFPYVQVWFSVAFVFVLPCGVGRGEF